MRFEHPASAPLSTFSNCTRVWDVDSCGWSYRRSDGTPLTRGYYVVTWPRAGRCDRRVGDMVFEGPFAWREAAKHALHARPRDASGTAVVAWWAGSGEAMRARSPSRPWISVATSTYARPS